MKPKLFGLAQIDDETGEPDPDCVECWGMETSDGAIMFWVDPDGRREVVHSESAESIAARWGRIFQLGLVWA